LDFGRTDYYVKTGGFSDIELASIADLHVREISEGFLSSLGSRPLRLLYRHAADSAHCVLIGVFAGQGRSVGFICGTSESVALRREFLSRRWFEAIGAFCPAVVSPAVLRRLLESLYYLSGTDSGLPKAEILNFVIQPASRGSGIGAELFAGLMKRLRARGATRVKIVTGAEQRRAQSFYEKVGARRVGEVEVHRGRRSVVYVYELDEGAGAQTR
jgi:ribosomal protein S18 acetylase RimI-like enzyme